MNTFDNYCFNEGIRYKGIWKEIFHNFYGFSASMRKLFLSYDFEPNPPKNCPPLLKNNNSQKGESKTEKANPV
jgi:hypothetical protein